VVLLAFWSGSALPGLVIGGSFGLVRALPVLATRHAHDPMTLRRLLARVETWAGPAERVASGALVAAGAAVVAVVSVGGMP
jgi:hypothetical protein